MSGVSKAALDELSRFARTRGQARRAAAMLATAGQQQQQQAKRWKSSTSGNRASEDGNTKTKVSRVTSSYFSTSSSSTTRTRSGRRRVVVKYEEEEDVTAAEEAQQEASTQQGAPQTGKQVRVTSTRTTTSTASVVDSVMEDVEAEEDEEAEKERLRRAPPNWETVYNNIKTMRSKRDAPVDTMGCEVLADPSADGPTQRFHILVALMLSSQTKDELTSKAVRTLQQQLPGGLTPHTVTAAETRVLEECIYGVGFWRRKAQYLKGASTMILASFGGDIPQTIPDLIKLPGVGMKMATITMAVANKQVSGIGVDTHVHRIANRLRWVRNTKTPEHTRVELERWMPRRLWGEVNLLLVGFGQTICQPRQPKCHECLNKDLCPSSTAKTRRRGQQQQQQQQQQREGKRAAKVGTRTAEAGRASRRKAKEEQEEEKVVVVEDNNSYDAVSTVARVKKEEEVDVTADGGQEPTSSSPPPQPQPSPPHPRSRSSRRRTRTTRAQRETERSS
ncbi:hypothetical protein PTSG_12076 [Salpingoeca rosetta]|uniref:Endonuclease III homolog n=1 Tax=Salpingoeca rosetta (strain ATCC 50818 / BSB-021) TaxID=946362 RepID=F2U6H6_SALR5|nr:uncharacterized protein PTSG_12076 [Salpingoeca rosetta]EGD83117.1 hypothetical protein PTSG_12076 [Salpingoeca rosetta]|eukprot:XP_004995481.1 hypothetical protein PTSG_12076 [Salpingoeca rosetta]